MLNNKQLIALSLFMMTMFTSCKPKTNTNNMYHLKPPIAKKIERQETVNGVVLKDDYYWLRNRESDEVLEYLKAENTYTDEMTKHYKPLQEELYQEMIGRINEDDASVPVKRGDYYYYSRMEKGKNYAINCRKKGSLDAKEEIILDENTLAEGKEYCRVGALEVSPDHFFV